VKGSYAVKRPLINRIFSPITGYVEHRKYPGWHGFIPFYRRRCERHGEYVTYPHGFRGLLPCPECMKSKQ